MAPARGAAEDRDGASHRRRRRARQGGGGARRLAVVLADVLIATIADRTVVEAVVAKGLKAGDPFDTELGGLADESAGQPVRIKGTITGVADIAGRHWVSVAFGRGNVVLISEYLTQVMDPLGLAG